jgi:ABC-type transport system involved in Fe-S cluster assembly fused permease/ATPase subunit
MKINDLRSNIGIVPQDCVLFNDTALYNIAYGGIRVKEFKEIVDNEDREEELTEMVKAASIRA